MQQGSGGLRGALLGLLLLLLAVCGPPPVLCGYSEELLLQGLADGDALVRTIAETPLLEGVVAGGSATRSAPAAVLRPLPSRLCLPPPPPYVATLSHVQAHLEMASEVPLHSSHFGVFPPALLALARRHSVMQLELSLTRGRWVSRAPP